MGLREDILSKISGSKVTRVRPEEEEYKKTYRTVSSDKAELKRIKTKIEKMKAEAKKEAKRKKKGKKQKKIRTKGYMDVGKEVRKSAPPVEQGESFASLMSVGRGMRLTDFPISGRSIGYYGNENKKKKKGFSLMDW